MIVIILQIAKGNICPISENKLVKTKQNTARDFLLSSNNFFHL